MQWDTSCLSEEECALIFINRFIIYNLIICFKKKKLREATLV